VWVHRLAHQERTGQIHVEDGLPGGVIGLVEQVGPQQPGIVDQHGGWGQLGGDPFHRRRDGHLVADVGRDRDRAPSDRFDPGNRVLAAILVQVDHSHIAPVMGEPNRDARADSTRGPGHQRCPAAHRTVTLLTNPPISSVAD
jgi:hypothetical protein